MNFYLIFCVFLAPFKWYTCIFIYHTSCIDKPVFFRFEVFYFKIAINNKTQCRHLTWTITNDWFFYSSEDLVESDCLIAGKCTTKPKIYLNSIINSISFFFVRLYKMLIRIPDILRSNSSKSCSSNLQETILFQAYFHNFESNSFTLSITIKP